MTTTMGDVNVRNNGVTRATTRTVSVRRLVRGCRSFFLPEPYLVKGVELLLQNLLRRASFTA